MPSRRSRRLGSGRHHCRPSGWYAPGSRFLLSACQSRMPDPAGPPSPPWALPLTRSYQPTSPEQEPAPGPPRQRSGLAVRAGAAAALSKKSKLTTRLDTYGGTWTGRKARGRRRITFLLPAGAVLDGGPRAVVRSLPIAAGGSRPPWRGLRRRPCCSRRSSLAAQPIGSSP